MPLGKPRTRCALRLEIKAFHDALRNGDDHDSAHYHFEEASHARKQWGTSVLSLLLLGEGESEDYRGGSRNWIHPLATYRDSTVVIPIAIWSYTRSSRTKNFMYTSGQ